MTTVWTGLKVQLCKKFTNSWKTAAWLTKRVLPVCVWRIDEHVEEIKVWCFFHNYPCSCEECHLENVKCKRFFFLKQLPDYDSLRHYYKMLQLSFTLDPGVKPHRCLRRVQEQGSKKLHYNAGHQEFSRCHTTGESEESITPRQSTQVRDPLLLWNPRQTSTEVQCRSISGHTKRTNVFQFFSKKTEVTTALLTSNENPSPNWTTLMRGVDSGFLYIFFSKNGCLQDSLSPNNQNKNKTER